MTKTSVFSRAIMVFVCGDESTRIDSPMNASSVNSFKRLVPDVTCSRPALPQLLSAQRLRHSSSWFGSATLVLCGSGLGDDEHEDVLTPYLLRVYLPPVQ